MQDSVGESDMGLDGKKDCDVSAQDGEGVERDDVSESLSVLYNSLRSIVG